jgi:hypothetical protein
MNTTMKYMIGSKNTFAFVLGDKTNKELQEIDIWVAGELVTFIDNAAFLTQFIASLKSELEDLKAGNVDSDYVFLNFWPTLDDVSAPIEMNDDQVFLKCHLYKGDGKIISAKLDTVELMETYGTRIKQLKKA